MVLMLRKTECIICNEPCKPLFSFPKDPERLGTWLQRLQLDSLLSVYGKEYVCNNGRLCGLHFHESAFTSTLRISYLLTNRLNQDCIENVFSSVRKRGGFRDNPSAQHFCSAIKNVIVGNFLKKSKSKNTEEDSDITLIDFTQKNMAVFILHDEDDADLVIDFNAEEISNFSKEDRQVMTHIGGVLANSYLKKTPCDECKKLLVGPKDLEPDYLLIYFREYKESVYGLKWPTEQYKNYVFALSETFYRYVNTYIKKPKFRENVLNILRNTPLDFFDEHEDHRNAVKEKSVLHFVNMMVKHEVKKLNSARFSYNPAKKNETYEGRIFKGKRGAYLYKITWEQPVPTASTHLGTPCLGLQVKIIIQEKEFSWATNTSIRFVEMAALLFTVFQEIKIKF